MEIIRKAIKFHIYESYRKEKTRKTENTRKVRDADAFHALYCVDAHNIYH